MNQDDVVRMAREVIEERGGSRVDDADDLIAYSIQLAALVAAHEREECAKVCEDVAARYPMDIFPEDGESLDCKSAAMARLTANNCANAIRTRGTE